MNFSLLNIPLFPGWVDSIIFALDIIIRIIALCWIPYNRKPSVALGWLMAIFLLPYVGILIFLVIGSRYLPKNRRERQSRMNELVRERTGNKPVLGAQEHLRESDLASAILNYRLGSLPMARGNEFALLPANH